MIPPDSNPNWRHSELTRPPPLWGQVQLFFSPMLITQAVVVLHQQNLCFWILHSFMHKLCEKNFKMFLSTKKSMLKRGERITFTCSRFMKEERQLRKVLSEENISTSSLNVHFTFMFKEIKNMISVHCTLSVPSTIRWILICPAYPPPLSCLLNPPLHSLGNTCLPDFM